MFKLVKKIITKIEILYINIQCYFIIKDINKKNKERSELLKEYQRMEDNYYNKNKNDKRK